jgi:hypothetical protein
VIGSRDDARGITDEFRRKLRGIAPLETSESANKST